MLKQLEKTILDEQLISSGDTIVVAVSGGPDSIALLHGLCQLKSRYRWKVIAAHLNHSFRGQEADEDGRYVEKIAEELSIPSFIEKINVPQKMKEWGMGSQETSRLIRYEFLDRVARSYPKSIIATAHHADDQVETIIMRLLRGTGIEGLSGIPIKRMEKGVPLIRPLLRVSRSQIEHYCKVQGLFPRTDKSNLSGKYTRNRIRLEVIPLLKRENPEIAQGFTQLSIVSQAENEYMELEAKEQLNSIIAEKETNKIIIEQKDFLRYHVALQRRMIKLILSYLSGKSIQIQFKHIEECRILFQSSSPSASLNLPGTIMVRREYNRVIFSRGKSSDSPSFHYTLPIPGQIFIPEIGRTFTCSWVEGGQIPQENSPKRTVLNAQLIHGDLSIRNRQPGDWMRVKGMDGSKKIKEIFIDEKIPKLQREQVPLLTDEEKVLWIPGIKHSAACSLSSDGERVLVVELQ